jgi:hypothetical protein
MPGDKRYARAGAARSGFLLLMLPLRCAQRRRSYAAPARRLRFDTIRHFFAIATPMMPLSCHAITAFADFITPLMLIHFAAVFDITLLYYAASATPFRHRLIACAISIRQRCRRRHYFHFRRERHYCHEAARFPCFHFHFRQRYFFTPPPRLPAGFRFRHIFHYYGISCRLHYARFLRFRRLSLRRSDDFLAVLDWPAIFSPPPIFRCAGDMILKYFHAAAFADYQFQLPRRRFSASI